MHTRICDILGIEHPIIAGGMMWFSTPEFAAAVSNAGALGVMTAARCSSKDELIRDIRKAKELTDKPFAVNISILPELMKQERTRQFIEAVAQERVAAVETSGRDPGDLFKILKDAGVKIIHKVATVRHALHAEKAGVDAVTVVGLECGGHPSMDDVGTMVLVPRAAESLKIPVIAGGGFADSRGLIAALALGAEGVCLGTRMLATTECSLHENFKNWIASASETETLLIQRSIRNQARVRNNEGARKVLEMESQGATLEDLMPYIAGSVLLESLRTGDLEHGTLPVGQAIGLIKEIKPVKQVIDEIMGGAAEVIERLNTLK
jgi:NAD(P)H-dependent flavin oxidoreductase YrpB (nitropropane dioxygenase family)